MAPKKDTKTEDNKPEATPTKAKPPTSKERLAKIQAVMDKVQKAYGEDSVTRMHGGAIARVDAIPSGSIGLDAAIGVGGYPRGRIVEIVGQESAGKTTMMLHAIANEQRAGGVAAFIDAEHALDPVYAQALGVNLDELMISQPSNGEEALNIAETLIDSGTVTLVVIDSVAALTPKAEIDGEVGDPHMGLQARMMGQALRKLCGIVHQKNVTLFFTNQFRQKIGLVFGDPRTTPGGNALKFYASVRLEISRKERVKIDGIDMGNTTKVKVVKNKVAPPFQECEFDILWGQGIDVGSEVLAMALARNIVTKSGSYINFPNGTRVQGFTAAAQAVTDEPGQLALLLAAIKTTPSALPKVKGDE